MLSQFCLLLQPARVVNDNNRYAMEVAMLVTYNAYIVCSLLAASRYHHPGWALPAALLGVACMALTCIVDTRYCFDLFSRGDLLIGDLGQTTITVAWFNTVTMSLTFISVVRLLLLLSLKAVRAAVQGDFYLLACAASDIKDESLGRMFLVCLLLLRCRTRSLDRARDPYRAYPA